MSQKKLDGVIESIRYTPDGKIAVVRAYERHGVVWSDHILLERKELSERLKQGKKFVIGKRKLYLGGVFETGKSVYQIEDNIITEGQTHARDLLAGVPVF
jgi:dipeptidyl aminopeptidase/acylaminoacyl peptidase